MNTSLFSYTSATLTPLCFVLAVAPSGMCWLQPSLKHRGHPWSDSISLGSGNSKYFPNRNCKVVNSFHFLHTFKLYNIDHMLCFRLSKGVMPEKRMVWNTMVVYRSQWTRRWGHKVNPIMCVLIHATWLHISFILVYLKDSLDLSKVIDYIVKHCSISQSCVCRWIIQSIYASKQPSSIFASCMLIK